MSIQSQLARNRAAFAALLGRKQILPQQTESPARQAPTWSGSGDPDLPQRMSARPLPAASPLPIVRADGSEPPQIPTPPARPVYSLATPPVDGNWQPSAVGLPAPSENNPVPTGIRFPDTEAPAATPTAGDPILQTLLRQLEQNARRNPQLHNEEEYL